MCLGNCAKRFYTIVLYLVRACKIIKWVTCNLDKTENFEWQGEACISVDKAVVK